MGLKACFILSWWLPYKKCCRSPVTQGGSAALSVQCLLWNRSTAGAELQAHLSAVLLQPPVMNVIRACGWDMGTWGSKLALPSWRCLSPQISSVTPSWIRSFGFLLRKAFLIFVLQLVHRENKTWAQQDCPAWPRCPSGDVHISAWHGKWVRLNMLILKIWVPAFICRRREAEGQ